jgi:hypothetical protein
VASEYTIQIDLDQIPEGFQDNVKQVINADQLTRTRRGKTYDLRELIESLVIKPEDASVSVVMQLTAREGATGRPEEVLLELGIESSRVTIQRTKLIFQERETK